MGFQAVIANVRVHLICDDVDKDVVCTVKETDGAPFVQVGGVSFFEYGSQADFGPFVWDQGTLLDQGEKFEDKPYWFGFGFVIQVVLICVYRH